MRDRSDRRHSNGNGTSHQPTTNHFSGVDFTDATPDTGELPLDDIDTFVVVATDEHGISERCDFRLPPYLKRQMKAMVLSRRFPYLDIADLIRHAISRHMNWLPTLRQSIGTHIRPALSAMLEICRDDEVASQIKEVFERVEERVRYHITHGNQGEIIKLCNLLRGQILAVPMSTARAKELLKTFDDRYGSYLQPKLETVEATSHTETDTAPIMVQ